MGPNDRDQFDDLLDGALKRYGSVEPRVGLEGRVLATLRETGVALPRKWIWAAALVACACMLLATGIAWQRHPRKPAENASGITVTVPKNDKVVESASSGPFTPGPAPNKREPASKRIYGRSVVVKVSPSLSQFPSPRPLTQQELMVAEYVRRFPDEAALVAQQQQEFDRQIALAQQQVESQFQETEGQER